MFQDVIHTFNKLGLKPNDAKIYLACLSVREGLHVHEIVEKTKIKRSTVDLILNRLDDKGYINSIKTGARYKYFAEPPTQILYKQQQVNKDFETIIPFLQRLQSDQQQTRIVFFEGKNSLKELYNDIFLNLKVAEDNKRTHLHIASGHDLLKIFPDMEPVYIKKRIREGIPIDIIAPQSSSYSNLYDTNAEQIRTTRYFDDKKFPFNISVDIFGDCVSLFSPQKPIGGVMIENPQIADSFRNLFKLMWSLLPD